MILEFIKRRVPGTPLGPKWEPPAGSLLALKLSSCASVSKSDARQIEEMESKALLSQPLVPVESKRELSSTHARSSISPSFCRNKTAPLPAPSVFFSPNQVKSNLPNKNKLVQSLERERDAEKRRERERIRSYLRIIIR